MAATDLPESVQKLGEFKGAKGDKGDKGDTGVVSGVTATTLATGQPATATLSGPSEARVLDLGLPRGATGATGATGPAGTITGATASALAAGATPTVSLGGTSTARTFAFGIPAGAKGDTGATGPTGPQGPAAPDASVTAKGIVELATQAESNAGTAGVVPDAAAMKASYDAWEALLRPKRPRAVWIGSSNAVAGSQYWPHKLSLLRNLTRHIYSIGGTGYCTPSQPFMEQAQSAVAALSAAVRDEVGFFFVADSSNDARSNRTYAEVFSAAQALYAYIRANFPNARIVVLPQVWPADTQKYAPTAFTYDAKWAQSAVVGAAAQQEALSAHPNSVYAAHSWTWLTGRDDLMIGNNDVHPNEAGHTLIANLMNRVLDGETILPETAWVPVIAGANTQYGHRGRSLAVKRRGWAVTLSGSAHKTTALGSNNDYGQIPYGFRPVFEASAWAMSSDTGGIDSGLVGLHLYQDGTIRRYGTTGRVGIFVESEFEMA